MAEKQVSDFDFYLRFAKRLVLGLVHNRDKFLAAAWLKKLMAESSGSEDVRTYYLKLLLVGLQQKRLIGPFQEHPCNVESLIPFHHANVMETVVEILKEDKQKRLDTTAQRLAEGDLPTFVFDFSADLLEYVAVQEIKNFGVHGYYATSKKPLNTWHRVDKSMFPSAAKGMIEVAGPPESLQISALSPPPTPTLGKSGGGDAPQATSTPVVKKKKRKQTMSTLGASPPMHPLGKVVEVTDDRIGSPPTWGSNLLQVNETHTASFEDSLEISETPRLNAGGGGNGSPCKAGCSTDYDMDDLAALGLRPEDLEDINLDDLNVDDLGDDDDDEGGEGFEASDKEIDDALDRYERMIAELEEENAEDIAKYGEDAGPSSPAASSSRSASPCPATSSRSRSPSPCPAASSSLARSRSPSPLPAASSTFARSRSPSPQPAASSTFARSRSPSPQPAAASTFTRSPSPCPAAKSPRPVVPSPLPSPRQVFPQESLAPGGRRTLSPQQATLVSQEAREIMEEAAEIAAAPAQSNVPRTKPVSRLPTKSGPASARVVVKPPPKMRPRQVYGPLPRHMASTSATRARKEPEPPPPRRASRIARPGGGRRAAPAPPRRPPPPTQDELDLASSEYWENFNRQLESQYAARPTTVQVDENFDDSFDDLEIAIGREMRARGEDPMARQGGTCPGENKDPVIGQVFDAAARAARRGSPQRRAREQMRLLRAESPKAKTGALEPMTAAEMERAGVTVENMARFELPDLGLDLDDVKVKSGRTTTDAYQQETEFAPQDSFTDLDVELQTCDKTFTKMQETDQYADDLKYFSPALASSVPTTSPRALPSPRRAPQIVVVEAESPPDYSNLVHGPMQRSPGRLSPRSPRPFRPRPDEGSPGREENLEAIEDAVNEQMVQQGIDNQTRRRVLNSPTTKAKMAELEQTVQDGVADLMEVASPPRPVPSPTVRKTRTPSPPRPIQPPEPDYEMEEADDVDMLERTVGPASFYSMSPDSPAKPSPPKDIVQHTAKQPEARPKHQYLRKGKKKPENVADYMTPAEERRPPRQRQPPPRHKSVMRMAVRRRLDFTPEPGSSANANEDSKVEVEQTATRIMDEGPYTEEDFDDSLDRTRSPGLVSSRGSPPRAGPASPVSPMSRPETMAQVLQDVRNYDGQVERQMSLTSWSRGDERRKLRTAMEDKVPGIVAEDEEADVSFEEMEERLGSRLDRSAVGRETPHKIAMAGVQQRAGQQLEMLKSPPRTPPDVRTKRERQMIDQRARMQVESELRALMEEEHSLQMTLDAEMPVGIPGSPKRARELSTRSPARLAALSPPRQGVVSAADAGWAAAAYGDDDYLVSTSPPISPPGSPEMRQAAEFQRQWAAGMAGDADMLDDEELYDYGPSPPPSPDAPSAKHRRLTVVTPERSIVQNTDMASPTAGGVTALNEVYDDVAMAAAVTRAAAGHHVPGSYSPRSNLNKASMVKKTPEGEKILLETTKMKPAKTAAVAKRRRGPPQIKQTRSAILRAKAGKQAKSNVAASASVRAKATALDPKEAKELGLSRADLKDLAKLMGDQWKAQDRQEKDARKKLEHMYSKLTPAAREELTPALFSRHRIVRDVAKTRRHRPEEFGVTDADDIEWRDAAEVIAEDGIPSPPPRRPPPVTPWVPKTPPKHHAEAFSTPQQRRATPSSYESTPLAVRSPTSPPSPTGSPRSMHEMMVNASRAQAGTREGVRNVGGRAYHAREGRLSPVGEFVDEDLFQLDSRPMEEFFDHGAGLGPIRTEPRPSPRQRAVPVATVGNVASPRTPARSPVRSPVRLPVRAAMSPPSGEGTSAGVYISPLKEQAVSPLGGPGSPTRSPVRTPVRTLEDEDDAWQDDIEWDDDLGYGKEWEGEEVKAPTPPSPESRRVLSPEALQRLVRQHQMSPEYHDKDRELMTKNIYSSMGSPRRLEGARSPGLRTVNESLRGELPAEIFLPGPQDRQPTPEELVRNVQRHQYTQHVLDQQRSMLSGRAVGTKKERNVPVTKARQTKLGPLWEVQERVQEPWRSPIKPYPEIQSPEQLQRQVSQHRMTPHYTDLQRRFLNRRIMLGTGTESVVRGSRRPDLGSVTEQRDRETTMAQSRIPRLGQLIDTSEGVSVLTARDNATGHCISFERNRIQAPYTTPQESPDDECPGDNCG